MKNSALEAIRKQELSKLRRLEFYPSIEKIMKNAAFKFSGNLPTLESAVGAFIIGQMYGWRVLRIIHGSSTYNKYEKILGIKFSDVCPDKGVLARRSVGLRLAEHLESFWKVATGKVKTGGLTLKADEGLDVPKIPG